MPRRRDAITIPAPAAAASGPLLLGWEEWVQLPDLALPAIKAKVDTGARTSALHAFLIEPFGDSAAPKVRFGVHPIPGRDDVEVFCSAAVIGRRNVTSSNGERETRYVIETRVQVGTRVWPIEVTLTNRETMNYRMLLGRQAIAADIHVDPTASFRQPKLSYRPYTQSDPKPRGRRSLRIALVSASPRSESALRLEAAAAARGHVLERLDVTRLNLVVDRLLPHVSLGDAPLGHYDAVIPLLAAADGPFGAAVVRQLEMMGSVAVNDGDALDRCLHPLTVLQHLARAGLAIQRRSISSDEPVTALRPIKATQSRLRCLVVGRQLMAMMSHRNGQSVDAGERVRARARALAVEAAKALQLRLATIDIVTTDSGPEIARVSSAPALSVYEKVTGTSVAEAIISLVEVQVRSNIRKRAAAETPVTAA